MAAIARETGAASVRVAANVRRLRNRAGMSTYELARRLQAIGWPIGAGGITRLEQNQRRVDADDLCALAAVFNCAPAQLLLPDAAVRLRGDTMRDAVALVEKIAKEDDAGALSVLQAADPGGLSFTLARMCTDLAREAHGDRMSERLDRWREIAEYLDRG